MMVSGLRIFTASNTSGASDRAPQNQAIDIADGNPLGRPTPQHIELMPKGKNFGLQGCARPEQPGHGVPDQLEEIAHRRDYQPIRRRSTAVLGLR
jgi:hypothetical protein